MQTYTLPLSDAFQVKYDNQWNERIQQISSKFERFADVQTGLTGKAVEFNFIGDFELEEKQGRFASIVLNEPEYAKRRMLPQSFSGSYGYDTDDDIFLHGLDLPVAKTIKGLEAASKRKADEVMLGVKRKSKGSNEFVVHKGGIFGPAYTGNDGLEKRDLDPEMTIPADYVEKGTAAVCGMTIAKLNRAITMLQETGVLDPDSNADGGEIVCAINPTMREQLISDERLQKTDFGFQSLRKPAGTIEPVMGIRFIITNKLPKDEDGNMRAVLYAKNMLKFGVWKAATVKVSERDDLEDTLQIRCKCIYGATRKGEEGFVDIRCKADPVIKGSKKAA